MCTYCTVPSHLYYRLPNTTHGDVVRRWLSESDVDRNGRRRSERRDVIGDDRKRWSPYIYPPFKARDASERVWSRLTSRIRDCRKEGRRRLLPECVGGQQGVGGESRRQRRVSG